MEIMMDARQKLRLMTTLQGIGVTEIKEFDVIDSATRKNLARKMRKKMKWSNFRSTIGRVNVCEKLVTTKLQEVLPRNRRRSQTTARETQERTLGRINCCWYTPDGSGAR